jgi:hypothetical protein
MKKQFLFLFTIITSVSLNSQISFKKGYFINNNDQKISCLIKTIDWNNNPTQFEYKIFENDKNIKANLEIVKEFGINGVSKYIRAKVNIDRSNEAINKLSKNRNPAFKEEVLFLKVLIDGKASLYQYMDKNLTRFFYKKESSNIEQLVFKSYKTNENKIRKNNQFKQQLFNNLKCDDFSFKQIKNIKYKKNDLILFFKEYSKCQEINLIYIEPKQKNDVFNLSIRLRLNSSSFSANYVRYQPKDIIDFGHKTGFGIGVEAEVVLPINKNRWTIVVEPTYQQFKSETINNNVAAVYGGTFTSKIVYNTFEVPLSIRHYISLNKNSSFFVNASLVFAVNFNSTFEFENPKTTNSPDGFQKIIETGENFGLGMGCKLFNKYSIEVRYQMKRDLFEGDSSWNSNYKSLSMIFGYSIF